MCSMCFVLLAFHILPFFLYYLNVCLNQTNCLMQTMRKNYKCSIFYIAGKCSSIIMKRFQKTPVSEDTKSRFCFAFILQAGKNIGIPRSLGLRSQGKVAFMSIGSHETFVKMINEEATNLFEYYSQFIT